MDTDNDNALYVHKSDGSVRGFECTKASIYWCSMRSKSKTKFVFNITTVEGQEKQYSDLVVSRAKTDRKLGKHGVHIGMRSVTHDR